MDDAAPKAVRGTGTGTGDGGRGKPKSEQTRTLIQGLYDRITAEHHAAAAMALDGERDLAARIRGALPARLDIAGPYHGFAAQFFKNTAGPESPLSPFSAESEVPRLAAVGLHRRVLAGTDTRYGPELADHPPQLLWLHQMGLVLFRVHGRSEGSADSRRLVERAAPVRARAIGLTRFRLPRPLVREVHDLLDHFLPAAAGTAAGGPRGGRRGKAGADAAPERDGNGG
ncbi:TetR family transcriptional regulator [Streptomyces carminius]|uniref:TetR family transcriptional regulator n=1 Tax=Streptomyces carminius TaxID=2665496 RepID=A0A2M8LWX1_9ACTN|nr:TetR family transcriptional regulator [Streptomyces carminius]PJE96458.1 TetR family transcriptional regulator [Streptomyces carminius]